MKADSISRMELPELSSETEQVRAPNGGQSFDAALQAASRASPAAASGVPPQPENPSAGLMSGPVPLPGAVAQAGTGSFPSADFVKNPTVNEAKAAAAYQQAGEKAQAVQPESAPGSPKLSDFEKYRDDQLLRNPGGRNYYHDEKKVVENAPEQKSFLGRIGKTLSAVAGNLKNLAGNIFLGSKFLYRGQNNEIKEAKTKGLLGTVLNFFKDLGSALSFGSFHPDREEAPKTFTERLTYSAGKLRDAFVGDLVEGIPSSITHMGKNLVLAGWHLVQVVPDSTIGNTDAGRKLTTSIFDNGHVVVEYITDIIPFGDAWLRVHASRLRDLQPPLLYNLKMPENYTGDTRWEYIRNTPFRKSIETVGALLADAAAIGLIGQTGFSSDRHHVQ